VKHAAKKGRAVYKPRVGSQLSKKDAQLVGQVCDEFCKRRGGVGRPEDLVAEVKKNKQHPLRKFFEWDLAKAAQKHWVETARRLMTSYTIVIEKREIECDVRGLQYVDSKRGYVPTSIVITDVDMSAEVLARAKRELSSFFHRYNNLKSVLEMGPVFDAIERVIQPAAQA
jgi:hypothetical protein